MPLSDLWTSPDSQTGSYNNQPQSIASWWQTGNNTGAGLQSVPGAFYSPIARQAFTGLPDALPNQTRVGTMDQAQQFDAGGVDRGVAQYNPNDYSRLWGGSSYQVNPFQGAGLDTALQAQILAGDRGGINHGLSAFVGGLNPNTLFNSNYNSEGYEHPSDTAERNAQWQNIANLAQGLGIDPRSYGSKEAMYNDLQNRTNDYYTVGGLTQATAGKAGGNLAQRTLYKFNPNGGTLDAVTRPVNYVDSNSDKGFIGREGLTALSMMMPMFGGWAGALGNGVSGTLSAGGGLGLTSGLAGTIGTGATNLLTNAAMNSLVNGGGVQGLLGGLGQGLIGAGVNSLAGGNGLSNLFNTAGAGQVMNVNPMTYYTQGLSRLGLGGSPLGQGIQAANGLRTLANLFRS